MTSVDPLAPKPTDPTAEVVSGLLWAFDVVVDRRTCPLILRRAPGGVDRSGTAGMGTKARVIRLAGGAGGPVPAVVHVLEGTTTWA